MIIKDIKIGEIQIPLRTPFKTALRTVNSVDDILVKVITDDGIYGIGEAPPTAVITGDTKGSITCAIQDFIKPAIIGMDLNEFDSVMQKLESCIYRNTSAKAAVDMALYDLKARSLGIPLWRFLGGAKREIETDLTVSVNDKDTMVKDSLEAVQRGFRILKIKVGKDAAGDAERLLAIRQAVGSDIAIRIDANQGWTAKEAIRIIKTLEDKGLGAELVEQPVKAHDIDGMIAVTAAVDTPVLADESVFSAEDAIDIIQRHAADYINIKLMKTGGIYNALRICSVAEIYHVKCFMGCMLESALAVTAASHLTAGKSIITMADLDGPSLCSENPYQHGPAFNENRIIMSDDPGLGIELIDENGIFNL